MIKDNVSQNDVDEALNISVKYNLYIHNITEENKFVLKDTPLCDHINISHFIMKDEKILHIGNFVTTIRFILNYA